MNLTHTMYLKRDSFAIYINDTFIDAFLWMEKTQTHTSETHLCPET